MTEKQYLELVASVFGECARILKRHNDELGNEEPHRRYVNEDERLDDPRHGQAKDLNR